MSLTGSGMKKHLLFIAIILFSIIYLKADPMQDISNLARLTGSTSEGTEFVFTLHPGWINTSALNFVKIYVAARTKAHIKVNISDNYTKQDTVFPNQLTEFTLATNDAMMYSKVAVYDTGILPLAAQIWRQKAIRLSSDEPVVCYVFYEGQYDSEGFLPIPVQNWGREYRVATYADPTNSTSQYQPSFTSIVADYDSTNIEFTLGGNESMSVPFDHETDLTYSKKYKTTLNKYDVFLLPGKNIDNDFSGSYVKSDKPVGVVSGNYCARIPNNIHSCNYTIEMEQPSYSWGKKYYIPTIESKQKNPIIKIFNNKEVTNVYRDKELAGTLDFNFNKDRGWLELRSGEDSPNLPKPHVYTSDKPVNIILYNTGFEDDNVNVSPFQMNILPVDQFQNDVVFSMGNFTKNNPLSQTYISLIYQTTNEGIVPDDIEIGWTDTTGFSWKKLDTMASSAGQKIEVDSNGITWMELHYKLPGTGCYRMRANNRFGLYCYGYDGNKSFGYPAAGLYYNFKATDSLHPDFYFTKDQSGTTITGTIKDRSQNASSLAGLYLIKLDQETSFNMNMNYNQFFPGDSETSIKIQVTDQNKDAHASLYVVDWRGNDTTYIFDYAAPIPYPIINKDSLFMGYAKLKDTLYNSQIFIKNPSYAKTAYPVSDIILKDGNQGFKIIADDIQDKALAPLDSIVFTVEFTSNTEGEYLDSIGIEANGEEIYYTRIRAIAARSIIQVDSIIDFKDQFTNTVSPTKLIKIANPSKVNLSVTGIVPAMENAFSIEPLAFNEQNPLVLTPGMEKKISVHFQPSDTRDYLDSIKILSDGKGNNTVILKGKGVVNDVTESESNNGLSIIQTDKGITFRSKNEIYAKTIKIFDMRGINVSEINSNVNIDNLFINTIGFSSGFYVVRITTLSGYLTKTFIITK